MTSAKKRLLCLCAGLAAAVLLLGFLLGKEQRKTPVREGNLIVNGDFSAVTGTSPDGWEAGMWVTGPGASFLEAVTIDGQSAALIENAAANDARFEQTVAVSENTLYRLSAKVRAEECGTGIGANVSFMGIYGTSRELRDTDGAWEEVSLYAQTGPGQRQVTAAVRLGGYGSENTGKAWFTDVRLEAVSEAPIGVTVLSLSTPEPAEDEEEEATGDWSEKAIPLLLAGAVLYVILGIFLSRSTMPATSVQLIFALAAGLMLRLILAGTVPGYGVDIGCFSAWAAKMAAQGPAHFYEAGYFCDYPPAYMLVLGLVGTLANLLKLSYSSMAMQVLLKLVPILCDLALAGLFYRLCRRLQPRMALPVFWLLALNPALIVNGSCWGQIDVVTALFMVLFLTQAREGRWMRAIPLFALAVLTKPQAGLLAPLGIAALLKEVRDRKALKQMGIGLLLGIAVTLAIALPFSVHQSFPSWLIEKYRDTLGSYDYATMSTGNLLFLLGGNWAENTRPLFGNLTYGQFGTAMLLVSIATGIALYLSGHGRKRLYLSAALTLQMIYTFGPKMHERYVIPGLAVLLLAFVESGDARLFYAWLIACACALVNIGTVLAFDYLIAPNLWLGYVLGAFQVILTLLLLFVAVRCVQGRSPVRLPQTGEAAAETADDRTGYYRSALLGEDRTVTVARADVLFMAVLSLVYGAVAFYDLGATKAPQTGYISSQAGERVVLDLGTEVPEYHFYYYGGISDTMFTVADASDQEDFNEAVTAYFDRGECFKWQALREPVYSADGLVVGASGDMLTLTGRYIELVFDGAGSALWEVAAVDPQGQVLPLHVVSAEGALEGRAADPETLVDEQDTVPEKPTYQNSMYFDEIYHARTGYEHAHALSTYETTHPPLGKVLMSLCIRALGMTPFAWRLAGTVAGILMLPVLYLLCLTLTGSRASARFAALLFSLDCMHFTQTRIATIDSFPVLFMMLMFLFMERFARRDFWHAPMRRLRMDLLLSGIFMGMAIASKWIGCYGAVGLALYFFAQIGMRARQWQFAKAHAGEEAAFAEAAQLFPRRLLELFLWCLLSFVLLPLVIYCLSYIPYLQAYGPVTLSLRTLRRIWDAQVLMYDYHANLVATHYFASPWYEWPIIAKPMWYYSGAFPAAGKASSIMAFGNPAVWWTGLAGIVTVLLLSIQRCLLPAAGLRQRREEPLDRSLPLIAVGFLSAYLPWVLVSRLTFIYHYFASVPFIILALTVCLQYLGRKRPQAAWVLRVLLVCAALVLFIAFYPLASGHEVSRAWLTRLNWFRGWMWF